LTTTSRRSPNGRVQSTDEDARRVADRITEKFRDQQLLFDRIDADYDLWTLKPWQPGVEESIAPEDIYTTNEPRVLAQKIIAFIAATELVVRIPNDDATEPQEDLNDQAELLAIGALKRADERLRRMGHPPLKDSLAFYSVVRGRFAAARALLRKDQTGRTFVDILPLDPRHLVIEWGEDEPLWAAYRTAHSRRELRNMFGNISFESVKANDEQQPEFKWEYVSFIRNRAYEPDSPNPFQRHPVTYVAGTIVDNKWLKPLHDVHALHFPVVAVPVDAQPHLTPTERGETTLEHFGESVFAENRHVWNMYNRAMSYGFDSLGKASDPRTKVMSSDGTMTIDEGSTEKGAQIPLSVANQEDAENFQEANVTQVAGFVLAALSENKVGGSVPPQAFGLLDKPLSSVALRQLGNNLEHRVMPRMKAVAECVELALQNILEQYETGGFDAFPVSGRTLDGRRFAQKTIEPEQIAGHDPVEVSMQLALPEDLATIWQVALQAVTPVTPNGEALASLEYARERILKLPSHKVLSRQNIEYMARSQDELAAALEAFKMAVAEQDEQLAAILLDRLRIAHLKRQVEGSLMIQQLAQMAAGIPSASGGASSTPPAGAPPQAQQRPSPMANPAAGGPGVAEVRGVGNQPSPDAGFNTTADRQRDNENQRLAAIGLERG
jgi:hypothetical protein